MLKFIFFDFDPVLIDKYRDIFKETFINTEFIHTDCRKIIRIRKVDLIVSPANSIGYMDGGIDKYYCQMFPGIQRKVQQKIKTYNIFENNHYILPVGSAFIVTTDVSLCPQLICAPTMPEPCNIEGTENVYLAFLGILECTKNLKNVTIAVPGLGTGCGMMPPEESAKQIKRAYEDFQQ